MTPNNISLGGTVAILVAFWAVLPTHAQLQIGSSGLPNDSYYNAFGEFYLADYKNAGKDFTRGAATAYRFGTDRFLDSVCYWVMIGECHYHLGNYAEAIGFYEEALNLYLAHNSAAWQTRVEVPEIPARQQVDERTRINWGTTKRRGAVANIPRGMSTLFGRLDAGRAYTEGGVVDRPEQRSVNVKEIMRCTALALHRRRAIKGAVCKYDPFTAQLATGLASSRANGALFAAWNNVLLGIAQASLGDYELATRSLANSLQFNGMDHNLTPVALLELAMVLLETGDQNAAAEAALEASFSAAIHSQYDMVEESLALATTIHLINNRTPYPALEPAIQWATRERARLLNVSLIERLAACYIEAGDAASAANVMNEARRPMSRNSLAQCVVNTRLRFASAQLALLGGEQQEGMSELMRAVKDFQVGSRWLYQLALSDDLVKSGDVTGRRADQLYSSLLRDPTGREWMIDPFECLAFLLTPHVAPMERWFEIKLLNKQFDQALEIGELVRRHRFYANLPLGGRLMSFRWVLEGPDEALTAEMNKQRTDFLTRVPQYQQLATRAREIRNELIALPLKPDPGSAEAKQQTDLFVELSNISQTQEALILATAVRRQSVEMAFPPQNIDLSKFYDKLKPHQVAFVMMSTGNGMHSFMVTSDTHKYLGTTSPRNVNSAVSKFLKSVGLQDHSGGVDLDLFQDQDWKIASAAVAKSIFVDGSEIDWAKYREMIVVPDGVLWYVPFELLHLEKQIAAVPPAQAGALDPAGLDPDGNPADLNVPPQDNDADQPPKKKSPRKKKNAIDPASLVMLGDTLHIRYAPTLFSAFGVQRPDRTLARTAVITGRMHPKSEIEQTQQVVQQLQVDIPDAVSFEDKMPIPSSLYGAIVDRLIVLSDIRLPSKGGPFAINPAQLDQGLRGSNLASWLSLPLWSPEYIILPGFTSAGAAGGRGKGNGDDIFLTACGLLASGSRAIMLSRWRVGGRHSMELTRRYAHKLSEMTPAVALRQSVEEARQLEIDLEAEPRIKQKKSAAPLTGEHPFFWAGQMVIEIPNSTTAAVPPQPMAAAGPADPVNPAVNPPVNAVDVDGANDQSTKLPADPNIPRKSANPAGDIIKQVENPSPPSIPDAEKSEETPAKEGGG